MDNIDHYIDSDGDEVWKLNGQYHRDDGPAYLGAGGLRAWFRRGNLHREDGPALIYIDGNIEWWLNGDEYAFDDYCKELDLTPDQILELKLKYG